MVAHDGDQFPALLASFIEPINVLGSRLKVGEVSA
jgi:hypothetical protein